jgi:hypothetical protein
MDKQNNTTELQPSQTDGIQFDPTIGEYRVIVGGQTVNFATWESTAVYQYKEACRVRREHLRNNPMEVLQ